MRFLRVTLAAVLVLAPVLPARAWVPERTPHRDADSAAATLTSRPAARGAVPGIVIARGGVTLLSLNATRAMTPASLMKLATTTAAMLRFGPTHRFQTRVTAIRTGRASAVSDLYLVGGGDPTLATEAYRRARFLPKPTDTIKRPAFASGSPTIEQLAARVAASGIRAVRGDLVADDTLFDAVRTQQGWLPSYLGPEPDTGLLSALTVNEGRGDLRGKTIVDSPTTAAAQALRTALGARGVTVAGKVRAGRAPRAAVTVGRVTSPPLAQMVDFINRYSVNYHAELLLKSLGASFGGAGTTAAGARIVREALTAEKIPLDGFRMLDGSGLSLLDRATPRTIAALLNRILTGKGAAWAALRASIPAAGEPGTLLRRMTAAPTGGNLRGKTGQVKGVRAMAGWVTASDGIPIVYVAVFNNAAHPFTLTAPLDLFGLLLARYPDSGSR
ncbi:MAG: D-alanyl-D-alanine carboxypeptidase/D-alanyl-D-alanine-endopeptidase [Actinomycetota bacterium]